MILKRIIAVALLLVFSFFPSGSALARAKKNFMGTVYNVLDGDSIEIESMGNIFMIRLYGIDAPEYTQRGAAESKLWLQKFLHGREVTVEVITRDRYNRYVAIVRRNGEIVNEKLLSSGLAWVYYRYCRKRICRKWKQLQRQARQNKRGIWRDDQAVPPWVWRHSHR